jgi:hypothetical protein
VPKLEPLKFVCTKTPFVYASEENDHTHRLLNLIPDTELRIIGEIPGGDGAPIIIPAGCGKKFAIPNEPWFWDVNTAMKGGHEVVVERHLSVGCPHCGAVADHVTQAVDDPFPFLHQGMSSYERRVLSDPELLDLLADLSETRQEKALALLLKGIRGGSDAGYAHKTEGAIALSAATAKTIIGVKSHANFGQSETYWDVAFDGVTASAVPVTVEWCYCTFGANAPGTNSTSTTINQEYGRALAAGSTAGKNWTTEPTTITVLREGLLSPNGGAMVYDYSLSKEPDCNLGEGFGIRCTAPATVNVRSTMKHRRC